MHHRNKAQRQEAQRNRNRIFSGDLRTKSKQKWNKIRHIPESITQTTQTTQINGCIGFVGMVIAILVWNGADKYIVWCWELRKCRYVLGIALLFAVLSVKKRADCLRQAHIKPLDHLLIILFFV